MNGTWKRAAVVGMVLAACLAAAGVARLLLAEQQSLTERAQKVGAVPADTLP